MSSDGAARAAGIVVLNKARLDPGIDHLFAVKIIDGVHAKGGKVSPTTSAAHGG
jgi:spermidine synthase